MDVQDLDDKVLGEAIVKAFEQLPAERIFRYSTQMQPDDDDYDEDMARMVNVDTDFDPALLAAAVKRLLL
jgi:hypothetical protein